MEYLPLGMPVDRWVVRQGKGTAAASGNTAQNFTADEGRGYGYIPRRVTADTETVVSRFSLAGAYAQVALDCMNPTTAMGHQGLAVDTFDGQLWADSATAQCVVRGPYLAAGDFVAAGQWQLFPAGYMDVNQNLAISPDASKMAVRGQNAAGADVVRVFTMATLRAGPGDYSESFDVEFATPDGWATVDYPFQALAASDTDILALAGYGTVKALRYGWDGDLLYSEADIVMDEFATRDAAGGVPNHEIEGAAYIFGLYHTLTSNGATAQRVPRIRAMAPPNVSTPGLRYREDAADWLARVTAAAGAPDAGHAALMSDFWRRMVLEDTIRNVGSLYILGNQTQALGKIDWMDPARTPLVVNGTVTWIANDCAQPDGATGWLQTPQSWYQAANYQRDYATVGAYLGSAGATGGAVIGGLSGTYTFLYPRNGSDIVQTRMNDDGGADTIAGSYAADGMWYSARERFDRYTVEREDAVLATHMVTATDAPDVPICIGRSPSTFSSAKIKAAVIGYMDARSRYILRLCIRDFFLGLAAL